jgi:hypothetical protein
MGQGGTRYFTISSNATESIIGTTTNTPLKFTINDVTRLTIAASTGAATFTSSITASDGSLFNSNSGTLSADVLTVRGGGGTGAFGFKVEANNGEDIFYTDNFSYNIIANPVSGRFGIGTTSPEAILHVNKSTAGGEGGYIYIDNPAASTLNNSVGIRFGSSSGASYAGVYTGDISNIVTNNSDGASALTFGTFNGASSGERMRITSGGNVGIGTTSPTGMLQVGSVGTNSDGQIVLAKKDGSPNRKFRMGLDANFNLSIGDFGNSSSDVYVPQITLNYSNGNVGIGTTSPNARLESQVGSPTLTAGLFYNYVGDQTATTLILRSARPDIMYQMQIFNNTSTECFRIEANGNVKNTNSSYGSLSDIKIKENISDATPKLDDLLKVRIRNYNIIGQDVKQIGVIAQELEEIFPSMVDENQDRDNDGNLLETTTKGVKYSVFVPMLIKAIQELKAELDELKNNN